MDRGRGSGAQCCRIAFMVCLLWCLSSKCVCELGLNIVLDLFDPFLDFCNVNNLFHICNPHSLVLFLSVFSDYFIRD